MRRLGSAALVVCGVAIIAQAIALSSSFVWLTQMLFSSEDRLVGLVTLLGSVLVVAVLATYGVLLIAKRRVLADKWFDEEPSPSGFDEQGLLRVALVVIGVLLLVFAVFDVLNTTSNMAIAEFQKASVGLDEFGTPTQRLQNLVGLGVAAVQLLAGWLLIRMSQPASVRLLGHRPETAEVSRSLSACPTCGTTYDPADYTDLATARCSECHDPLQPGDV